MAPCRPTTTPCLPTMEPCPPDCPMQSTGCWPTRRCSAGPASHRAPTLYERARPGYSDESVGPPGRVARHRARRAGCSTWPPGTGKLTRSLVATGRPCRGREPSASMRDVFASVLPDTPQVGADRRAAAVRRPVVRRRHRGPGVPLVRRPGGPGRVRPGTPARRRPRPDLERARRVRPAGRRADPDQQVGHPPALPGGTWTSGRSSTPAAVRPGHPDPVPLHPGARPHRLRRAGRLAELHRRPARGPAPGDPGRRGRPGRRGSTSRSSCPTSADLFCARGRPDTQSGRRRLPACPRRPPRGSLCGEGPGAATPAQPGPDTRGGHRP